MSVEDLEQQVFDIELIATEIWELGLDRETEADLSEARSRDGGAAFDGFADRSDGVWLLALMCSTCQNPAPLLLSVLEPT